MAEARLLDHRGNWTAAFEFTEEEPVTCRSHDALWDHRLFASTQLRPGDNLFQAMTFCGSRATFIPGKGGEVDCPKCLDMLQEEP